MKISEDITIKITPFPGRLHNNVQGATVKRNGKYIVLIDGGLPEEEQRKTIGHELAHIFLGHFEQDRKDKAAEEEADQAAEHFYKKYFSELTNIS